MHLLGILIKEIVDVDGEPHHARGIAAVSHGDIYDFKAFFTFLPPEKALVIIPPSQPGAMQRSPELVAQDAHEELGYPAIFALERDSRLAFLNRRHTACRAFHEAHGPQPRPRPQRPNIVIDRIYTTEGQPHAADGTAVFHDGRLCTFQAEFAPERLDRTLAVPLAEHGPPDTDRRLREISDALGFTEIDRHDAQAARQFRLDRIDACREFMRDPADWPWPLTSAWSET